MRLAHKYSDRPPAELPLLFQRILQNAMRDHFRRQKVRNLWTMPISALSPGDDGDDQDPLETLAAASNSPPPDTPHALLERSQVLALIEKAVGELPARQRQAFVALLGRDGCGRDRGGHGLFGRQRENALLPGHARIG